MEDLKTEGQKLSEQLAYEPKNAWEKLSESENQQVNSFCDGYIDFLNKAKTEREAVDSFIVIAEQNGFKDLNSINAPLNKGDRVYLSNRGKTLLLAVIGEEPLERGFNAVGAHVDAPRLDLKQNPIYESSDLGFLKTHYYGGIKKYQWTTIPLAIHGVVIKEDGTKVNIVIGEDDSDPVFCISDLLPHLSQEQMQKKMSEVIVGENLNILIGNKPYNDEKVKEKIKLNILKLLNEKYGIKEKDFYSAEIEIVPAIKAREVGLDRSMVGGYGQDDRVCAYAAAKAIFEVGIPQNTAVCILADKEEIGSVGNTGMQSRILMDFISELIELTGGLNSLKISRALRNSKMISADVNGALDPAYEGVMEKRNSAFLGKGVCVTKYTGHAGKSGANDAHAEFLSEVIRLLDKNNVAWQIGELGKVDQGGGGTIAGYFANLGMDVIDCGTALLSMHSPFEIASKVDIYMTYKAYLAFIR
ncbi:MAG: aminopeptidase [Deltaproteobacteria bacterium]